MNMLTLRLCDLTQLGVLLDGSITDGANTLSGISFEVSNPRPMLDEASKAAVEDAKVRAELLAAAAGERLGGVISISEIPNYGGPQPMFRAQDSAANGVPVANGKIGLTASVTVTYALAD
jgi:uncharacterized protein YggE